MNLRPRAIVKDLKLMKNSGWLLRREDWLIFARQHLPKPLHPLLEKLRLWPVEKILFKQYRWVKLTKNHAEMIVPVNFMTSTEESEVSTAAMLDAAIVMIRHLLERAWPHTVPLQCHFSKVDVESLRPSFESLRLMVGWQNREQEDLFFQLRQTHEAEFEFQVEGYNTDEQLVVQIHCRVKLSFEGRLELSRPSQRK